MKSHLKECTLVPAICEPCTEIATELEAGHSFAFGLQFCASFFILLGPVFLLIVRASRRGPLRGPNRLSDDATAA